MGDCRTMIRVLIVEDSPTSRALLSAILRSDPEIEVVGEAVDGVEGVRMARALRPDVLTMDVEMPRLNGLDVLRRIRASARTKGLPVFLFAEKEELNTLDGHGLVADGYIHKPLDFAQLSEVERQLDFHWQVEADV